MKRREAKSKGEQERYTHLNVEFQRIASRDKKAFPSDQSKDRGKNNMGKIRDLFKKIRDTKGTFHAKRGSIKDRNSMDLTDSEDTKKRWQEYWSGLPCPPPGDLPNPRIFARNVPLVSLIFLKRSLVFPILLFSSISLHQSLRKVFLSLLAILWNLVFRCYIFPFFLCF